MIFEEKYVDDEKEDEEEEEDLQNPLRAFRVYDGPVNAQGNQVLFEPISRDGANIQRLMNKLFHPYLDRFVVVYLDDIVVYSKTLQEHVEHLREVLKVLWENQLYIKMDKCSFAKPEVSFLGHKIKDGKLMMEDCKVHSIQEWEPPTKVHDLRSFLGLVNYYRRFIKGYSATIAPLTNLLKKNKTWKWTTECQEALKT
ncbi:uncharacterized mitochondrial protein AtMg00860-like [Argentina anserina]|uniref:uncharacterized mitochondrial protein AtMg00860-like n=1 Tax=Argentina anserina TaxID=57926 RepID=UPI002176496D|nr:uncharacterized mitochondrial protein AtMg00860-like [Potentilla anserina]